MHKADRKMAVLLAVKEHKGEIAFPDLLILLKNKFAERSVRRWLHELTEEGFIKKSGQKKGTRYQAIIKEDRVPLILDSLFSESSTNAISYVTQPIYLRKPTGYNFNWLEAYEPNKTFYLTKQRRTLLKQEGERRYQQDIAGTYARHIYNRLMIDLSYNSSRLEGNTYSLIETEKLILEGDVQIDKLNDETVMILNHKEAIRYLVDNAAQLNIEPHIIFTLHYLLADGLLPAAMTGIVRDHGVKIGGSTYLPSDNKQKLEDILSILCKKAAQIVNPYEQSFFLLTHIAYLQAFEDCNKRTARLSANISLICNNLVPMSFNDIPKDAYANAMIAIYEVNDPTPLADLYLFSYLRTCKQYDVNIESLGFDRIRIQYRRQRREMIAEIIRQKLTGEKILPYIKQQSEFLIPSNDREQFETVVKEDISVLSLSHIIGMGISSSEFIAWKQFKDRLG